MNEELMRQNLESNRYQSSGIVDNIVTMGIANSSLENVVKNSLAKESSAAFQFAMGNGGIYRNNALMGSSNLYRLVRFLTPESLRSNQSSNLFGLGRYEVNKFSVGQIDPKRQAKMSGLSRNISENLPNWDPKSDIIPTGIGFQNKGYKEFFTQLDKMGFKLDKAKSAEVNLDKSQYKIYQGLQKGDSKYNYIKTDKHQKIISSNQSIDNYVGKKYNSKINKVDNEIKKLITENAEKYDPTKLSFNDEALNKKYIDLLSKKNKIEIKQKTLSKRLYDEKDAYDFIKNNKVFNSENVSDDFYNFLTKDLDSNIQKVFSTTAQNSEDVFSDIRKLEKAFKKIGKSSKEYISKIDASKRTFVRDFALKNSISEQEAIIRLSKASTPESKEALKVFRNTIDDVIKEFSDDVGIVFAKKTGFQKLMGNNATRFLTGVQAGMSSFLWQLPLMVVSTTASINQENAIQNFVSSYLYNPKIKEMYNNEATNRSMQISQNIHYSNLQDTQNIIIKHNTAERYLNDLDPINIDLDYSQKSFDLNPRNE